MAHVTKGGELGTGSRGVLGCVVGEDGDAIEGAVVLGVVQPTLEAMGAVASDADADDV